MILFFERCLFFNKSSGSRDLTLKFEKDSASIEDANESPLPVKITFLCCFSDNVFGFLNFFKKSGCKRISFSYASNVLINNQDIPSYIRKSIFKKDFFKIIFGQPVTIYQKSSFDFYYHYSQNGRGDFCRTYAGFR